MISLLLAIIYLCFISLGLPDSLLGSAWPNIYQDFNVPISYAGIISMIISLGTIISSLNCDKLTKKAGTGLITAISVTMTATALFGFAFSTKFWMLIIWAIPFGLGAGCVDASINNYVALHYKSHHMSWLHCMWGVGAAISPYIMGYALSYNQDWHKGYLYVAIIQIVLTIIIFFSLSLWKKSNNTQKSDNTKSLSLKQIISIPGAKMIFITFFSYCALEQTAMLWSSSYLVLNHNFTEEKAASFASLFFIGMTFGRALNGFLTFKFSDKTLIKLGHIIISIGLVFMLISFNEIFTLIALGLIGLGCAPIYPCIIHSTPEIFGKDKSQSIIGILMACAYLGTCLMPPLFGIIANNISISLFPFYLLLFLFLMAIMYNLMIKKLIKKIV